MKNLLSLVVLVSLVFIGCQKSNLQPEFKLVQEENDNKEHFMTWLEQNTIVIDEKHVTEDGYIGILYEEKHTKQRIFVPIEEINTKEKPTSVSFEKAFTFNPDDFYVACEGSGHCCAVYSDYEGGATIRLNPACTFYL
ncbi:MAG: hypothetical protein U9Q83_03570 [Bacteroidota bacterium]|nr:hypothetical protein [Bacteroidota bacterium]